MRRIAICVFLGALAVVPLVVHNAFYLHVMNLVFINAIVVVGLNLATGVAGQIVLGQAALMGIGAYATGVLMVRAALPWYAAGLLALALSSLVGIGLGAVSTRIKGHYLAITTLGFNEIFRLITVNETAVTGGPSGLTGIPQLRLPGLGQHPDQQLYLPLLGLSVLMTFLALRVFRSRFGRNFRAIRDNEVAAEAMGVNSRAAKIQAFVLCSLWAGLGGVAYVLLVAFVAPNNFTISESIRYLVMLIIGGLGSIPGSFLGALVITILPEALRAWEQYYLFAYAVGIIVVLLGFPRGLGAIADRFVGASTGPHPLPAQDLATLPGSQTEKTLGTP
jgi:branched-chain amino acid transport system permease protein